MTGKASSHPRRMCQCFIMTHLMMRRITRAHSKREREREKTNFCLKYIIFCRSPPSVSFQYSQSRKVGGTVTAPSIVSERTTTFFLFYFFIFIRFSLARLCELVTRALDLMCDVVPPPTHTHTQTEQTSDAVCVPSPLGRPIGREKWMKGDTHTHTRTGFACGILGSQERERETHIGCIPLCLSVSQSAIKSNRFLFDFPFVFGWPRTTTAAKQ